MMNGYEAGKGHFSCYSPCRFRGKGGFVPVGSHSEHFAEASDTFSNFGFSHT
jgi:hypothetical protein